MTTTTYRTNAYHRCSICHDAVYGICARCRRPLCLSHLPVSTDERCVDCEMVYDTRRLRIGRFVTAALFIGVALALVPLPLPGALLAGVLLSLPFALWGLISRSRFLAEGYGNRTSVILTRQIEIAPATGEPITALGVGLARTDRSEPPCSPMYQRTYGH